MKGHSQICSKQRARNKDKPGMCSCGHFAQFVSVPEITRYDIYESPLQPFGIEVPKTEFVSVFTG